MVMGTATTTNPTQMVLTLMSEELVADTVEWDKYQVNRCSYLTFFHWNISLLVCTF